MQAVTIRSHDKCSTSAIYQMYDESKYNRTAAKTIMDIEKVPTTTDEVAVPPKLLSKEYDVANQILADTAEFANEEFSSEEDRKLRWKIDWRLIPVVSRAVSNCQQHLT